MNIYDFKVKDGKGAEVPLKSYQGKVLLVVNTATHCGYTKQYEGLQKLYEKNQKRGFEVLDFPSNDFFQTPENDQEISSFCSMKYHTTFKTFSKIKVNGAKAEPLYQWLRKENPEKQDIAIRWNFNKFLINRKGEVVARYDSKVTPEELQKDLDQLLG